MVSSVVTVSAADRIVEVLDSCFEDFGSVLGDLGELKGYAVERVNWFLFFTIVRRLQSMTKLFSYLEKIEDSVFLNEGEVESASPDVLRRDYREIQNQVSGFLEFSRKFVLQNQELLAAQTPLEMELLAKLKGLSMETQQKLLNLISEKEVK